jgi:hypothetical protein
MKKDDCFNILIAGIRNFREAMKQPNTEDRFMEFHRQQMKFPKGIVFDKVSVQVPDNGKNWDFRFGEDWGEVCKRGFLSFRVEKDTIDYLLAQN